MDAAQETSVELVRDELDMWLHSCDICLEVAISPVAMTCGHFFCRSCLNEAFHGEQRRICPVCRAESFPMARTGAPGEPTPEAANSAIPIPNAVNREPAARTPMTSRSSLIRSPIARIGAPAEPTPEDANSEIPIPNAANRGPAARTPMTARSSLISTARMVVVQDYLEEGNELIHNIQLTLSRRVSDLRRERIRDLEQVVENLVQMNLAVLRELEDCNHDRRRMGRRIAEMENPTVHGVSAFARRERLVRRRISLTPTAAGNDEAAPGSVESRLSPTDN